VPAKETGEDLKNDTSGEPIAEISGNADSEPVVASIPGDPVANPAADPSPGESAAEPAADPISDGPVYPPHPESGSPRESPFEICKGMMNEIQRQILMITENQDHNGQELKNLYNNYSNILRLHDKAAEELDRHRKGLYRQLLDPVLIALARIYIDYLDNIERLNAEQLEDPRLKKNFSNMFEDILQLVEENDVETYVSKTGDKWSPKFCKIGKKTDAAEKEQHGIVIKSIKPGFHIGNRVLIPENVEVYIFNNN
jgi:molecular chaperone GrpE (heat shock protein)